MRRVLIGLGAAALLAGCGTAQRRSHTPGAPRLPAPPATVPAVGAPGPQAHCTETIDQPAAVEGALQGARPGDVVCLASGHYGNLELSGIAHAGNVTLTSAPRAVVHLSALTFVGPKTTSDLTVQGMYIDGGVAVRTGSPGGLVFQYDTIADVPGGYAFYFYAAGSSPGHYTQTGVRMLANQIDHVGACLEVDGGAAMASQFVFSRNVCGPGIGEGTTTPGGASHYVQVGGITGLKVDNNAFLGPMASGYQSAGLHNNVLHVFGDASGIEFSGNLMWHTQSRGQTVLLEEGHLRDVTIEDNLDVEDPACDVRGQCAGYAIQVDNARALTVRDNTIVDSFWGMLLTAPGQPGYPQGRGYDIARNLVVGTHGNPGISYGQCSLACAVDHNVTDDRSTRLAGAVDDLAGWVPRWRATDWTPRTPYVAPPPGYWRPLSLPWSAGYVGAVGP